MVSKLEKRGFTEKSSGRREKINMLKATTTLHGNQGF